jgi:hypothetical protein
MKLTDPAFWEFRVHRGACAACAKMDLEKMATISQACLTGSVLIKRAASQPAKKAAQARSL